MIRLLLMRHANALHGNNDHSRELSDVGLATARRVALKLAEIGWLPDRVISSSATRCVETLDRMRPTFDASTEITIQKKLYLASPETIGRVIAEDGGTGTVLILAHNPGLSVAASIWSGRYQMLSPASLVRLSIDAESFAVASPDDVRHEDRLDDHIDAREL